MSLGNWGEETAERYLRKKGYKIIERNFRCRLGEIDIIALYRTQLVFIEVKTRQNQRYGLPCEAITSQKLRHLKKSAAYFIVTAGMLIQFEDLRLDVIEIITQGGKTYLHHIENITG